MFLIDKSQNLAMIIIVFVISVSHASLQSLQVPHQAQIPP